jgi:ribosomal protein S18 acetylase RimI-like enzyme
MGVTIRPAVPSDYDRIAAVIDDWWGRPLRQVLPRLFLDHFHDTSFVAEDGAGLSGFLVGFLSPANREDAYVHFVGVEPGRRHGGLGRELYERFFALAREAGRSRVRAVTAPVNEASIAFHRRLGFEAREVADYDGPDSAKVVFERTI